MFKVTLEQLELILSEIEEHADLQSLVLHIEDLLEEVCETYEVDPLEDEVEPLYMALAGYPSLTDVTAHLRTFL
jgi:hypothetical protein